MCGIAGVVSLDGDPVDRAPVARMVQALMHRGPDGHGVHVDGPIGLGHTRLSILDPTPAGAQPMLRDRNVLVHNGEVYNYIELAAELRALGERIDSATDTEMILAAYRSWGIDAVARFNGMFAFALWDADRRRLVLARDRMGVKPLYIRRTARSLAFASEPQALVASGPLDGADAWVPEPQLGAIRDFLVRGMTDHTTQTFFDQIVALAPGHLLIVESIAQTTRRYWVPPPLADDDRATVTGDEQGRDRALVEEFGALFDSSVRLRLRSDVPIGTCLSGGLDSSSIVATVARLRSAGVSSQDHEQVPRLAFHARFPADGVDESSYAEAVAASNGVRLVYRTPSGHPLLGAILPVLRAQGEPYGGASINAQYAVMAAAHDERLKVLLDGQGADELLGGYLQFLGVRTAGLLRSGDARGALREIRSQVARGTMSPSAAILFAMRGALPGDVLETVRASSRGRLGIRPGPHLAGVSPLPTPSDRPGTLLARRLWQSLTSHSLPALLRYEDRNSMAFGVEARVPFLDVRLVEMAVRLPDRLRIDRGVTKAILRQAMKGRIPEVVRDRRDKLGFVAPQRSWLTAARSEVTDVLRDGQIVARGWVEASEMEHLLVNGFGSRRASEQLWRMLIVEAWLRLWWPDRTRAGERAWEAALAAASVPPAPPSP
jgi:asparagine synthase (glutamine-hydrolysing)